METVRPKMKRKTGGQTCQRTKSVETRAKEGDGPWVHSLLQAEEDEDTESDQLDASCTDSLSREL